MRLLIKLKFDGLFFKDKFGIDKGVLMNMIIHNNFVYFLFMIGLGMSHYLLLF